MSDDQECLRIGYLTSRYPDVSHTFILREITALRRKGVEIHTLAVRKTPADQVQSEGDIKEWESTWAILPASPVRFLRDHARAFAERPRAYVETLLRALCDRMPGARGCLWATFYFGEAILVARELERRGIRHLHNHFANAAGDVGYLATRYLGISWSQTLHGRADFDGPTRPLLRKKIAAARFTACVSHFARAQAMWNSDPEHWDRILVARCGLDLSRVPRRNSFARKNERAKILTVGRLSPEKGQLGLVEAFASVIDSGIDAELCIVGGGPEQLRIEREVLKRGVSGRVHMAGSLAEEQVLEEMTHADLFVLSSFTEGLPVVLMEAMAVGVPVVAPRLAGIPELVDHEVTGHLFTPASWTELSALMKRLLSQPTLAEATVEKARHRVTSDFDVNRVVEPLLAKFQDSLSIQLHGSTTGASVPASEDRHETRRARH